MNQDNYVVVSAPPSIIYGICNSNGQWIVKNKFMIIISDIQCLVSKLSLPKPSLFTSKGF